MNKENIKFSELGISPEILKGIPFEHPTEIQAKAIPLIMAGKDLVAGSATGSGKTLAFACGIVDHVKRSGKVQALVLVPTRELAQQVSDEIAKFSKHKQLRVTAVYGGVSLGPQADALRSTDVAIGTPGRVLDLIDRNALKLHDVNFLVLDEADRMLDMGFIDDVKEIIKCCPPDRQTLLFSATISRDIFELAHRYMRNPQEISVGNQVDPKKLKQIYYDIYEDKQKLSLLVHLLKNDHTSGGLVMVFCNTQSTTDFVSKNLHKNGIDALAIHGGFSQAKRTATMEKFHANKFTVLVCTDVAARGLDIQNVSHVYNFDLPRDPKSYVHRIGRTARAGKEGLAVNLLSSRDHENFSAVLRHNDVDIQKVDLPEFEKIRVETGRGGFGGRDGGRRFGGNRGGRNEQRDSGRGRNFGNRGHGNNERDGAAGQRHSRSGPQRRGGFNRGGGNQRRN
jgi:superfamily II DNA/RNA helicase